MSIKFEYKHTPYIDWDSWNKAHEDMVPFTQSKNFAEMCSCNDGGQPFFLRIFFKGKLLGQALLIKKYFFDRLKGKKKIPFPYFECLQGPIFSQEVSAEIIFKTYQFLSKIALKNWATHIRIIPNYYSDRFSTNAFSKAGYTIQDWATYVLNMNKDHENLFSLIPRKTRNKIRKAEKNDVIVKKVCSWDEFKDEYIPTMVRIKGFPEYAPYWDFRSEWANNRHYYLARKDSDYIACLGVQVFNNVAYVFGYGISDDAVIKGIPAQDLLHWHGIRGAHEFGADFIDFTGVNPNPVLPKEKGIFSFKKKWGGDMVCYPIATKNFIPAKKTLTILFNFLYNKLK
ncbi:hypothetical protein [Maridesulfovibrio zosterae]|uniref:hypothetical protein n=1 Tax=Maridesulfovibrio zosterae TaxID=82171 RepID=UPI0004194E97|nr:hypothetical protein [Maridesulfovibrio zosterae]